MSVLFCLLSMTFLQQPDYLKVGEFNCEFLTRPKVHVKYGYRFDLGELDKEKWDKPGYRDAMFHKALEPVSEVIGRLDVDILVLAEVGDVRDVKELVEFLKQKGIDYPYYFVSNTHNYTFQHVAILSRYPTELVVDKIPGQAFFQTELDDPEEEREADVEKGIHVICNVNGMKVNVIGLHLPSERNGFEQDARRVAAAQLIRRYSYPIIEKGEHLIIAGDLNDEKGQPAIRVLRGLDDIFEDLIQTGQVPFFKWEDLPERWTHMYKGMRDQLDQVLVTRSLRSACFPIKEGGIRTEVLPNDIQFQGDPEHPSSSDHRPIRVTFHLKR